MYYKIYIPVYTLNEEMYDLLFTFLKRIELKVFRLILGCSKNKTKANAEKVVL